LIIGFRRQLAVEQSELAAAGGQCRLVWRHDSVEEVASLAEQGNRAPRVAGQAVAAGLGVQRDGEIGMAGAEDGMLDLIRPA
jgi:hypothetical protein